MVRSTMSVPQYTTPTFVLSFTEPDLDLTMAYNVYVTFRSKTCSLTKSNEGLTVEAKKISVYLTQQETAKFQPGEIEIQANWTTIEGGRFASNVAKYSIDKQLLTVVIE